MENRGVLNNAVSKLSNPGNSKLESLEKIGQGKNRMVYRIVDDYYGKDVEGKVVKFDFGPENKMEVDVWDYYKNKKHEKYLVPIRYYSDDFCWIIMDYGEPIEPSIVDSELYKILSNMGSDISKDDFISHNRRQKCCDYASIASKIL